MFGTDLLRHSVIIFSERSGHTNSPATCNSTELSSHDLGNPDQFKHMAVTKEFYTLKHQFHVKQSLFRTMWLKSLGVFVETDTARSIWFPLEVMLIH